MAESEDVGTFKILIQAKRTIHVEQLPNTEGDLGDHEINSDPLLWKTIEVLVCMLRDNRLLYRNEFELLGKSLYSVLFNNRIGTTLHRVIHISKQVKYWRVELKFATGQELLASLPWEYLYCPHDGGYFLAAQAKLVLTRNLYVELPALGLRIPENDLPLRVLFVAASPRNLHRVECDSVLTALEEHQNEMKLHLLVEPYNEELQEDYSPKVTFANLEDVALSFDPHVIHFVGHGHYLKEAGGELAFMDLDGNARWITGEDLASTLAVVKSLRLVFLQACESALSLSSGPYEATLNGNNPYGAILGIASHLIQRNIPAVLAMQYRIGGDVANLFARAFYGALADSKVIDTAVQEGRLEILQHIREWSKRSSFGLPVLYLRESDSLLGPNLGSGPTATKDSQGYQRNSVPPKANVALTLSSAFCPRHGIRKDEKNFCRDCGQHLLHKITGAGQGFPRAMSKL